MTDTTKTQNVQLEMPSDPVVGSSQQGGDQLLLELARSRDEIAALRREQSDIKAKQDSKKKKEADAAALKAGQHEQLLKERTAALEAMEARIKSFEDATAARIEAMVKKLPEAAQKEIDIIKDSLSADKLETFVAAKLESQSATAAPQEPTTDTKKKAPPPSYVSTRNLKESDDHVHPETKILFRRLSAPSTVYDMAKHVHGVPMNQRNPGDPDQGLMVGDHRFRLKGHRGEGTMNEINEHDTAVWIEALRSMSPPPRHKEQLMAMNRMEETLKDR